MDTGRMHVFKEVEKSWDEEVAFLQSLVRCPSTLFNEEPVQQMMARKMTQLGLTVDMFEADISAVGQREGYSPVEWGYRKRPQVVGIWKTTGGTEPKKSLVLNGHADVVGIEPSRLWTRDPWGGEIAGNRMYGRGTADMKAGLTAIVYAVAALRRAGVKLKGDVIVQSVIEEECTGNGTLACLARGYVGDGALIAESMGGKILLAQLGVLWLRTVITGAAGHVEGSSPAVNAIEKAYTVIQALKELEAEWNSRIHPAFAEVANPINFNTGIIRGGDWPSTVPAECELVTRLAFYPGIKPEKAKEEVIRHLRNALSRDSWFAGHFPEFSWYGHHDEGIVIDPQGPFIRKLAQVHSEVTGQPAGYTKVKACTDARFWHLYYDKPVTCYGPTGGNIHAVDEYVELPGVLETTKVIAAFIMEWCGYECTE